MSPLYWLGKARDVDAENPEGYYLIAVHFFLQLLQRHGLVPELIRLRGELVFVGRIDFGLLAEK